MILLIVLAALATICAGLFVNLWAAAGVAIAAGLFITWFTADNGPTFGPSPEGMARVTFKQVLLNLLTDARDLLGLRQIWAWAVTSWRYCGETLGALLLTLDAYVTATPELKAAVMGTPYGLPVLLAVNFFAFIATRQAKPQS